ncbi:MAG: LytTR family DNA-binding domain-containing protein [Parabacteroides sp.]|nr:LytTR family DNA-binding domain-containing protein [Parabacteroides sp.]
MDRLKLCGKAIYDFLYYPLNKFSTPKWQTGITTGLIMFCSTFLYLFSPFNITGWLKEVSSFNVNPMFSICLSGGTSIIFSHLLLYLYWKKKEQLFIYDLIISCISDIVFLSLVVAALYNSTENYWQDLIETINLSAPILILAYILLGFILIISIMKGQKAKAKEDTRKEQEFNEPIYIHDSNKETRLKLEASNLLYIEAADNYITVYYLKNGHPAKEMIRNTLKNAEAELKNKGIIRCHRSFLVNSKAISGWKKNGRNYELLIKGCNASVPVARSYIGEVIKGESSATNPANSPQETE